jgi:hypothetical protein
MSMCTHFLLKCIAPENPHITEYEIKFGARGFNVKEQAIGGGDHRGLKQVEAGRKAEDITYECAISKHTIDAWKADQRLLRDNSSHAACCWVPSLVDIGFYVSASSRARNRAGHCSPLTPGLCPVRQITCCLTTSDVRQEPCRVSRHYAVPGLHRSHELRTPLIRPGGSMGELPLQARGATAV